MRILLLISFILLFGFGYSQKLIPAATKIRTAYEKYSADTASKKQQQDYINAFPADTNAFLSVFQTKQFDQLYSDYDKYLNALGNCAIVFPAQVIDKCINIGKNLVWDADAVGQLQGLSVFLAAAHTQIFIVKFKALPQSEQNSLIKFYADVENHNAYPEYQKLIGNLANKEAKDIAERFEIARTNRMKQKDHGW